METVGERDHVFAAGNVARQLERGLHRVGARGTRELDHELQVARLQDLLVEGLQELRLCLGVQVETVADTVGLDVIQQRLLEGRVVMAIVQCAGAGQEIEVLRTVLIVQVLALGPVEYAGEGAGVAANFGFNLFKNLHVSSSR